MDEQVKKFNAFVINLTSIMHKEKEVHFCLE